MIVKKKCVQAIYMYRYATLRRGLTRMTGRFPAASVMALRSYMSKERLIKETAKLGNI